MLRLILVVLSLVIMVGCAGANGGQSLRSRNARQDSTQFEKLIAKLFIPGERSAPAVVPTAPAATAAPARAVSAASVSAFVIPKLSSENYESLIEEALVVTPAKVESNRPKVTHVVELGKERIVVFNSDLQALDSDEIMKLRHLK